MPYARERVLPNGLMQVVFNLRENCLHVYDHFNRSRPHEFPGALICGACAHASVIDTAQQAALIGVAFQPGGAFPFLPVPMGELQNAHAPLEVFWGAFAAELRDRLREAATAQAQFQMLEQALLRQIVRPLARHPAVDFALRAFHGMPIPRRIADVTEQIGLCSRQFSQVFRSEVGMTPKQFYRVQRFQYALRRLEPGPPDVWADLALTCGYCDQAHFINDFREFSGLTPTAYLLQRAAPGNHVPLLP